MTMATDPPTSTTTHQRQQHFNQCSARETEPFHLRPPTQLLQLLPHFLDLVFLANFDLQAAH
jgi:hypothetical protein